MPASGSAHETVFRNCPLCEAHCGIAVEVDRAAGRVVSVRGDAEDPFSAGYICPKAYGLKGLHEDPDRLRKPLRRVGSGFEEIGWDEAFDLAAERLLTIREEHGADSIATYLGNPNAHDLGSLLYGAPFQRALGTRWRFSATSVDQLPKNLSCSLLFGGALTVPIPDVDHTDLLLVLGANPLVSNGSLMTAPDMPGRLRRLRERGGRLVVVDPRRSETARMADLHLAIRPGADAHFLMSLVHTLFDEQLCAPGALAAQTKGIEELRAAAGDFSPEATEPATGIAPERVRALARELAAAERAACYGRIGTCTQEFGTLASWLVDAVNLLTGNLDREGGALFPEPAARPGGPGPRKPRPLPFGRWHSRVRGLPEFGGELPVATLAEEIDSAGEQRVRALVTIAGNPVLSTPNGARLERALESLDFMLSIDIYLNETSRYADLILPSASPVERSNLELPFQQLAIRNVAKFSPAALPSGPDEKEPWEILTALTARLAGATLDAVDEAVFSRMLGAAVGGEKSGCPDVGESEARAALGDERGPERLLDLMLRAGPYGDRFDENAEGPALSLQRLRESPHGIDLGPLRPRLAEVLATESGKIELAHPLLLEDVERLRASLAEHRRGADSDERELLLIGRRQVRNNNSWMHNVHSLAKGKERCTLLIHPDDAAQRRIAPGERARVRSRVGEVEVRVELSEDMMPGVVSLPHGFGHDAKDTRLRVAAHQAGANSNLLCDEDLIDALSGNAVLNGIPVELHAVPS